MARDPKITSRIMSKIRSKDTKAEIKLRSALWNKGYRFRKNYKGLPGSPDIVFTKKKIAIFVDGDFWHGNNWRLRKLKSRAAEFSDDKKQYWITKIKKNMARDKRNNRELKKRGWKVLRFWESDIKKDSQKVVRDVKKNLGRKS